MRAPPLQPFERMVWAGHPSWADHAILFLFMGLAAVRAAAAARLGDWGTVLLYLLTIGIFSGIAALFHYLEYYQISSQQIRITTGFWMGHTRDIPLSWIRSVTIRRLPFNGLFDIGTIEIQASASERGEVESVILKGLPDPERLKRQVDMLAGLRETGLRDMMNMSE